MADPNNRVLNSFPKPKNTLKEERGTAVKQTLSPSLTLKTGGVGSGLNLPLKGSLGLAAKLGVGSSSRLPSFKGPRDLTLSAAASSLALKSQTTRAKKVFTPNIPVRREKGEKLVESKSEKSTKKFSPKGNFAGRGRGRGKEKEFVQTRGSLFGEGIAAASLKRGFGYTYVGGATGAGGGGGGGKSADNAFLHKPVLNPDAAFNIDKEAEEKKLKEIMRDNFIDDLEDPIVDWPVQLPLVDTGKQSKEEEEEEEAADSKPNIQSSLSTQSNNSSVTWSSNLRIKEEPCDDVDVDELKTQVRDLKMKDSTFKAPCNNTGFDLLPKQPELPLSQILSDTHSDIIFFQLPSCLPSHPPEVKIEPNSSQSTQPKPDFGGVDISKDKEGKQKRELCTLESLPEGQIGTLKLYESGRAELWLGNHKLEINRGTQVGFLQDVVNIETDAEKKTGSLSVLGHIRHRLVCTPDFETLVSKSKS